jgi:hypothetical protein
MDVFSSYRRNVELTQSSLSASLPFSMGVLLAGAGEGAGEDPQKKQRAHAQASDLFSEKLVSNWFRLNSARRLCMASQRP